MLCELNCADGTLHLQLNDTFHMMLPYINTGFRTEWVRKDLKQKGRKEERKERREEREEKFGEALQRQRHGQAWLLDNAHKLQT